jgi:hypothetical protein
MAKELGILKGYSDGTAKPGRLVTVAEASKMVSVTFDFDADTTLEPWYRGYLEELEERHALPTTLESVDDIVTRGEMAEILYRLLKNITTKSYETYESLTEEVDEEADLKVSDLYIDSEEMVQGVKQAWVGFKVENIGEEDVDPDLNGKITITFGDGTMETAYWDDLANTEFLKAGGWSTFVLYRITTSQEIKVCVDPQNLAGEPDETKANNCRTETLTVSTSS